jgi:hypothetical protein
MVFEKRGAEKVILALRGTRKLGGEESYIIDSFMLRTPHQILFG